MIGATATVIRLSRRAATDVPPATLAMAKLCILDWFGLALAGSREPIVTLLTKAALAEGGTAVSTAIGAGRRFSPRQAALLNGTAGHALDYDDVNLAMRVHPTTVLLPPLLALAESRGLGGRTVIDAFVVGYEAAGMIGSWLGDGPYLRGFHQTGTVGSIGAAAGCAYLLGLNEEATARAYGLAATQAGGLKAQFGTMAKPLHAGRAAETGLISALWAQAGMTSRTDILECAQGFAATQGVMPTNQPRWGGYELDRNLFKYHASCFGTHGTIEAITTLRKAGLRPEEIRAIRLTVDAGADRMCNISTPVTGSQARFSLRFAAALAAHGLDTADGELFSDTLTGRAELIAIHDRTSVILAPAYHPQDVTTVEIELTDGNILRAQHDVSRPSKSRDSEATRLRAKFKTLSERIVGRNRAEMLAQTIMNLDGIDDLTSFMRLAV